jgi:hypothetical protein
MTGERTPSPDSSVAATGSEATIISADEVHFVPERFFPKLQAEMTVATATNLLREFCTCPACDSPLDPDTADGHRSDRDVIWSDEFGRHSAAHECPACGRRLELLAEEKARPSQWASIPDRPWVSDALWVEMDDGGYFVTMPGALSARVID